MMNIAKELQFRVSGLEQGICITSPESRRVVEGVASMATSLRMGLKRWTCISGFRSIGNGSVTGQPDGVVDPQSALMSILEDTTSSMIYLMDGIGPFLRTDNPTSVFVVAALQEVMAALKSNLAAKRKVVLLTDADFSLPTWLRLTQLSWPLPTKAELSASLSEIATSYKMGPGRGETPTQAESELERIASAEVGLTMEEAQDVFALSLAKYGGRFDYVEINSAKKQAVSRSGAADWVDPPAGGLANLGGLEELKRWLKLRRLGFSQAAREYGLSQPRGCLIFGVPGSGKSLIAKSLAAEWQVPLLSSSADKLSDKYVGGSESKARKFFDLVDSVGECVVLLEEAEKLFAGASGDGSSDGGAKRAVLGMFLTWMQDRKSSSFLMATSNDVSVLPAELLRKGRFDDLFFVDLPSDVEREAIWQVHITKRGRDTASFDMAELIRASEGLVGSEIECALEGAMFKAFSESREVNTLDIVNEMKATVPLSKTMAEKIDWLRKWSVGRARSASLVSTTGATTSVNMSRFAGMAS